MCGGIIGMLTMSLPPAVRTDRRRLLLYTTAYSSGRLISYTAAGALAGGLSGQVVDAVAPGQGLWALRLLANTLVVGTGLHFLGWWPRFAMLTQLGALIWRRLEPLGKRLLPVDSLAEAILFGMIWGWLPCVPVYSAVVLAMATGHAAGASLFMFTFGLGTLPAVIGAGTLTGLATRVRGLVNVPKVIGGSLIVMGLLGLTLAALSPPGGWPSGHHHF